MLFVLAMIAGMAIFEGIERYRHPWQGDSSSPR